MPHRRTDDRRVCRRTRTRTHMHSGGPPLSLLLSFSSPDGRDHQLAKSKVTAAAQISPRISLSPSHRAARPLLLLLRLSSGWVPQPKVISGRGATASHHGTESREARRKDRTACQSIVRSFVRSFARLCRRHRPRRRCRETKIHQLLNSGRTNPGALRASLRLSPSP